jgi:ribosomal protein S3
MEAGAKGCEVVVSGKLRAARAKSMKVSYDIATQIRYKSRC